MNLAILGEPVQEPFSGRLPHEEDVRGQLDGKLESVVLALHLDQDVSLVEAEVAARTGYDARVAQLLEQFGVDLRGLGEATDGAVDRLTRRIQLLHEADDALVEGS